MPANAISLTGTASDDGLPQGSTLTYLWSKVSGPGTVSFGNASSAGTTANFSASGLYTLRLTVSDSALNATDEVNILVNQPPAVNAGPNQTINFPTASVSLTGTVSDDGLPPGSTVSQTPNTLALNGSVSADNAPLGAPLTVTWSQVVSGPAPVSFAPTNTPATTATFNAKDTYVLRLTASVPSGELRSMTDLSGNTLTVTPNGITSSTGLSVPFVRDGQGRITQITDTASKVYRYNYNAAGNLDNVELPTLAARPSYTYTTDHHLLTSNIIESLFAAVRLRKDAAKRFRTARSGVHLIWQLLLKQEKKWLRFCGAEKCANVLLPT